MEKPTRKTITLKISSSEHLRSLQGQLEAITRDFQESREKEEEILVELMKMREKLLRYEEEAKELGMQGRQIAFYHFFRLQGIERGKAKEIVLDVEKEIRELWHRDWWLIEGLRRKVKVAIYKILISHGIDKKDAEGWLNKLFDLVDRHYRRLEP